MLSNLASNVRVEGDPMQKFNRAVLRCQVLGAGASSGGGGGGGAYMEEAVRRATLRNVVSWTKDSTTELRASAKGGKADRRLSSFLHTGCSEISGNIKNKDDLYKLGVNKQN